MFGPFLTCTSDQKTEVLFPAPADSLCINDGKKGSLIYRLKPQSLKNDEGTDLENKLLTPVFLDEDNKGKPAKDSPKFWTQKAMIDWLSSDTSNQLKASEQGIQNLPIEVRTHVSIDPGSHGAKQGHLFQTRGLDFGQQRHLENPQESDEGSINWGWQKQEFGLACSFQEEMNSTLRTIGGESRLGRIKRQDKLIPECPHELAVALNQVNGFRLILATPAIFKNGYLPDWIDQNTLTADYRGMKLRLHAISVPRWQAGTSWDMTKSKGGKGMRNLKRLVPAGSVYWFERLSGFIQAEGFWLTSISDECKIEYEKEDGYGLTLPGSWNIPDNLKQKDSL